MPRMQNSVGCGDNICTELWHHVTRGRYARSLASHITSLDKTRYIRYIDTI